MSRTKRKKARHKNITVTMPASTWSLSMRLSTLSEARTHLQTLQEGTAHHKRVGVKLPGHAHPPSLEQVCRRCPEKKLCGELSAALAEVETRVLTRACALCGGPAVLEPDPDPSYDGVTDYCHGCSSYVCLTCDEWAVPENAVHNMLLPQHPMHQTHLPEDHLTDPIRRATFAEKRREAKAAKK